MFFCYKIFDPYWKWPMTIRVHYWILENYQSLLIIDWIEGAGEEGEKKQEFHQLTGLFINLSPIYRRSIKCWLDFDGPSSKLINFKWVMLSLISIIKTAQGHWQSGQSPFDQLFRRVLQSFCGNFVQLFKVSQISTAFQVFFHKFSKNYLIFRIF